MPPAMAELGKTGMRIAAAGHELVPRDGEAALKALAARALYRASLGLQVEGRQRDYTRIRLPHAAELNQSLPFSRFRKIPSARNDASRLTQRVAAPLHPGPHHRWSPQASDGWAHVFSL